jgi:hypothetical protein
VKRRGAARRRQIAFVCEACDRAVYGYVETPAAGIECAGCRRRHVLQGAAGSVEAGRVTRCLRCGADRLYTQKDFNRNVGLGVFVVAAILSIPTWGVSLLVATLLDLGLYYALGSVTICYSCGAQHRGFELNPAHGPFDLHVAEAIDNQPRAV